MKNEEIIICECQSVEHQMVVRYDSEDDEVYISIHLNKKPFWRRVLYGLKHIFGYQCRFGAFDEFILNPDDLPKIEKICYHLERRKKNLLD